MRKLRKKKWLWITSVVVLMLIAVVIFNKVKSLPEGISYEGDIHYTNEVEFLTDLTYQKFDKEQTYEHTIFKSMFNMIEEAEEFIVVDMFLFNSFANPTVNYPQISDTLTKALLKQKQRYPDLQVVFITDPINNGYHSYVEPHLKELQENGIEVVLTSLSELRDSNPGYSAIWRTFFQVFGQRGKGWLPNAMAEEAPDITLRSYLKLLNVKANHRKAVVTEKDAIIASANVHDASGYYSNIALKVSGSIIKDIVEAEQAVIDYSGGKTVINVPKIEPETGDIAVQYVTEGKILKALIEEIDETEQGDDIWIGMFYLADRQIVNALTNAAQRKVNVNLILDPNKAAFGQQKIGLPNLPVADELNQNENVTIRWYNAGQQQFHTKLLYIKKESDSIIIGGSANFTTRNLDDLNLENNLVVKSSSDKKVMRDVEAYFHRLWTNEDGIFTVDYEVHKETLTPLLKFTYWLQKITGLTTY